MVSERIVCFECVPEARKRAPHTRALRVDFKPNMVVCMCVNWYVQMRRRDKDKEGRRRREKKEKKINAICGAHEE